MFEIMEMSTYAKELLEKNNVGIVHSIYKNTINITIAGSLVSIHPEDIIKTPMSLKMSNNDIDLEKLDFKAKDSLKIYRDRITIGNYIFNTSNAKIWNPSVNMISLSLDEKYDTSIIYIKKVLANQKEENYFKDITLNIIEKNHINIGKENYQKYKVYISLNEFIINIGKRDLKGSANSILNLLGFGLGLTPSGDDFIMGMLSAFTVVQNHNAYIKKLLVEIKESLKDSIDNTTFVSRELYIYILEDSYSSIFLDIYASIEKQDRENLDLDLLKLINMGHSSGIDTLSGIVFGINIIKEIEQAKS